MISFFKTPVMKRCIILVLLAITKIVAAQEVLHVTNGSAITVQNGATLFLQGGITLDNGSLLTNNGSITLKNNFLLNQSNWQDNSLAGALAGNGLVIFNSDLSHQFFGTTHFNKVRINTGGLMLNNSFVVEDQLHLVNGKINTGINYVFLTNANAAALLNDAGNPGYANSWVNGNLRRRITANTSNYDFPVGDDKKANLLQFLNNNLSGVNYLTASFAPKPGTDAGLFAYENGAIYNAVNDGGVWYLTPDANPSSGNYALQLFFTGFSGLADNQFGILRRPNASSNGADWMIPAGSLLEPVNGLGRKVSDGFARRKNISSFSQFGIGMMQNITCDICTPVCTYTQGFYSNPKAMGCYYNNGIASSISSGQIMLNAFGASTYQVFGSVTNRQFFTLFKDDISDGDIFKMLPGFGNSQALLVDNILPYSGAYYSDKSTWYLVPIETNGSQKGKIKNLLLSQLMTLWLNLRTSNSLGNVDLTNDTLVTIAQTFCGSGIPTGSPAKFGLPHSVILYLNGGNGYAHDVSGLFQLANDILGGANTSVTATDVQAAVTKINEAFDGCRILVGTIPMTQQELPLTKIPQQQSQITIGDKLIVTAFPNPFQKQFSLEITSPVSGIAVIEYYSEKGERIHGQTKFLTSNTPTIVPFEGPLRNGVIIYRVGIATYKISGIVIGAN
jgi:hypothetical protein